MTMINKGLDCNKVRMRLQKQRRNADCYDTDEAEGVYLRRAKVAQPENVVGTPLDPGFR